MADMYTPEEIQEIFERYHDAVRKGIPVSESLAKEMADATKGVKNYTNELNFSLKKLGTSSLDLSKNLYKGAEGAAVFNDAVDSAANTVSVMLGPLGLFGKILGTIVKVAGKYVGAVNEQADKLYKTYQDISRAGTIGAGGMTEVYQSMQKFGYSLEQLGEMTTLLRENSQTLARFGGTAFQGAQELANLAQVMQRGELGATFRNMGASTDEINRYLAGYIKRETGLGQTRSQINKNLEVETARYLKELIAVQKLTGQSREQLEEKEAQAAAEQAFAYTQYELKQRMAAGDQQAAAEFQRNADLNRVLEGKAREEFVQAIGGDVSAMEKLMLTVPGFVSMLQQGETDTAKLMDVYAKEVKQSVDNLGEAAKFNFYNDFQLPMSENLKVISQYTETSFGELLAAARKNSETTDEATKEQTKLRMAHLNTRENLNDLINLGINPVTRAMAYLAEVVENLTSLLPGGKSKGYGKKGTGTMGGSLAATGAGAAAGAALGSVVPGVGTVLGGLGGGLAGFLGYQMHGGTGQKPAAEGVSTNLIEKIIKAESGGRNIGNIGGTSSAFGIGQITKGTFEDLVKSAPAGSALAGKTFEDMKTDVGLQREALNALTAKNTQALTQRGLAVNDAAVYLAHFLGAGGASRVLGAPDNTPITSVVGADAIAANPNVFKNLNTVADLKTWAEKKMGSTAVVAGTDSQKSANKVPDVSGAFGFTGRISGPMSGYRPNILMHGTENISIQPRMSGSSDSGQSLGSNISALVERLDEMIYLSKAQLGVNEKIMRAQA